MPCADAVADGTASAVKPSSIIIQVWQEGFGRQLKPDEVAALENVNTAIVHSLAPPGSTVADRKLDLLLQLWEEENRWLPQAVAAAKVTAAQGERLSPHEWEAWLNDASELFKSFLASRKK